MYAVIADGAIHYLGNNLKDANSASDQLDGKVMEVETLESLAITLAEVQLDAEITAFAEGLSDAAQKVIDKLNEAGLNAKTAEQLGCTLRDKGEKAVAEVRSLGLKSMKTVGDSFIAIGDLLQKAGKDKEE